MKRNQREERAIRVSEYYLPYCIFKLYVILNFRHLFEPLLFIPCSKIAFRKEKTEQSYLNYSTPNDPTSPVMNIVFSAIRPFIFTFFFSSYRDVLLQTHMKRVTQYFTIINVSDVPEGYKAMGSRSPRCYVDLFSTISCLSQRNPTKRANSHADSLSLTNIMYIHV